jgi:hypothetical protein
MSLRLIGLVVLIVLVAVGGWMLAQESEAPIQPAPEVVLAPSVPTLDVEINNRFIERFIVEDEEIQAALRGETLIQDATGDGGEGDLWTKTNEDVLFEQMAPWVYINYRKINDERSGQFLNMKTRNKTPYISVGGTLSGTLLESLDPEKAVVRFADATQELYLVSENPPPFDPSVPRTPEQIAEAQKRYREMYMKQFIVQGKEYDRLRGQVAAKVPPREDQLKSQGEYLNYAAEFAQKSQGAQIPPEAIINPEDLSEEQRAAYEQYRALFNRTPEDVNAAIESQRQAVQQEMETINPAAVPAGPGENPSN